MSSSYKLSDAEINAFLRVCAQHDIAGVKRFLNNANIKAALETAFLPRALGLATKRLWRAGDAHALEILIKEYNVSKERMCQLDLFTNACRRLAVEQVQFLVQYYALDSTSDLDMLRNGLANAKEITNLNSGPIDDDRDVSTYLLSEFPILQT